MAGDEAVSGERRALIANADDGGLHAATDAAILACFHDGVVRSASVIANGPTAERFVPAAVEAGLDLGLHVNLTEGRALTGAVQGLTNADGYFLGTARKAEIVEQLWREAPVVEREIRAQWERLVALGANPTHIDGHNHVHLAPSVWTVLGGLAPSLFVRTSVEPDGRGPTWFPVPPHTSGSLRSVASFVGHAYSPDPGLDVLRASLERCGATVEWMVHPGRRPGSAFTDSEAREREVAILCSAELGALLDELGYAITSFGDLLREEAA